MKTDKLTHLYNESIVNINGLVTSSRDAKISIFDRGFLYGDSIYEVMYSKKSTIVFLEEHLLRLEQSANYLNMDLNYGREQLTEEILKTLKASKVENAYIRLILTRGESSITLDPNESTHNNLVIIVKPQTQHPEDYYKSGIKLMISDVIRNDKKATNPSAKSGNYLNNVMAMADAKKYGANDALMVNNLGQISEGTTFNIWMIKNNCIYTPSTATGLLEGITRKKILELCLLNKINVEEKIFYPKDILDADLAFITSSTRGIMPVYQINEKIFGQAPEALAIMKQVVDLYDQLIISELNNRLYHY